MPRDLSPFSNALSLSELLLADPQKRDVVLVLRKGSSFYHEKDLFALCLFPCAVM